jgi:hypothetical protein
MKNAMASDGAVSPVELISELAEYYGQFEALKLDARDLVAGLTDSQFNWRAAPGRWSIAECLDHLNVTAALYIPVISEGIKEGRARRLFGAGPFRHGYFGNLFFVRLNEPPVKVKVKAPKNLRPQPDKPIEKVLPAFMEAQENYLACVREANGLHLSKIKIQSPASRFVKLSLGQSLAAMAAHERRHLWQARAVKNDPGFPVTEKGS